MRLEGRFKQSPSKEAVRAPFYVSIRSRPQANSTAAWRRPLLWRVAHQCAGKIPDAGTRSRATCCAATPTHNYL